MFKPTLLLLSVAAIASYIFYHTVTNLYTFGSGSSNIGKQLKSSSNAISDKPRISKTIQTILASNESTDPFFMSTMEDKFNQFIKTHNKYYGIEEREERFITFLKNHAEMVKLNELHGPCRLTGLPAFGVNAFMDSNEDVSSLVPSFLCLVVLSLKV